MPRLARHFALLLVVACEAAPVPGDQVRPTISLVVSAASAAAPARVRMTARASDDVAVERVEFLDGGKLRATRWSAPYEFDWLAASRAAGTHAWTAKAYDVAGNVAESEPATVEVRAGATCGKFEPISTFVTRDGTMLRLGDRRFEAIGANLYYLPQQYAYGHDAEMNDVLDAAVCLGLRVIRVSGYNDATNDPATMRSAPGVFEERGLAGLDRTIAEAKARGIRVIVTLANNWADFGGLEAYARWAGRTHDDFFRDATMQGFWLEWATLLTERENTVTHVRYRDEPAILAWELANELRCRSCGSADALVATVDTLSRELARLAPNQLVSDGGEGFDENPEEYPGLTDDGPVNGDDGSSYRRIAALPAIDLVSVHFYPDSWGLDAAADARPWFDAHARLAYEARKVPYLGEFGVAAVDAKRAPVFESWLARAAGADAFPLAAFWQLTAAGRTDNDGFAVFSADSATPATVAGFAR